MIFWGNRVSAGGRRRLRRRMTMGNGMSDLPDLHYIKQRAPSFRSPENVGSRAHAPQTVVHTTSKSAPINALLRYQCTRLFVDGVRGPTLTHLNTGVNRLFAK